MGEGRLGRERICSQMARPMPRFCVEEAVSGMVAPRGQRGRELTAPVTMIVKGFDIFSVERIGDLVVD